MVYVLHFGTFRRVRFKFAGKKVVLWDRKGMQKDLTYNTSSLINASNMIIANAKNIPCTVTPHDVGCPPDIASGICTNTRCKNMSVDKTMKNANIRPASLYCTLPIASINILNKSP